MHSQSPNVLSKALPTLIRDIAHESRQSRLARVELQELARRRIQAPQEILEWASRDHHWSFTLAEMLTEPVTRPRDLAVRLVVAIVDELEQERELFGGEASLHAADDPETHAQLSGNIAVESRNEVRAE